jgi:hypothetical protein
MINNSFLDGQSEEQTNNEKLNGRRTQRGNDLSNSSQTTTNTTADYREDYIFVHQDPLETAKQIEEILNYYQRDLRKETNTQLKCDQYLITRLIDFIRPAYSSNKKKSNDLDTLIEDIGALHDKRYVEQQEKNEQLYNEIRHFKKLIITAPNEDDYKHNTMTKVYRMSEIILNEIIIY